MGGLGHHALIKPRGRLGLGLSDDTAFSVASGKRNVFWRARGSRTRAVLAGVPSFLPSIGP